MDWVVNFIGQYGYVAVFILMFIENIFPPIPSEIILGFSGYLISSGYYDFIGMNAVAICGSLLGSYIFYFLGYFIDEERRKKLWNQKWIHYLGIRQDKVQRTQTWFLHYGNSLVFFGRFIPMIRSFISIPAGIYRMPFIRFSLYSLLGILFWDSLLILFGIMLGEHYEKIAFYMKEYSGILFTILVIFLLWKAFRFIYQKRK